MPLANNSTGAGTGDGYNYSNPTMVAGILSPADGDVYVYGYDDGRKQVIIRKVSKSAQVPHKGMTAHPVYTNNLLDSYQKHAVVARTTGATHNPQAVVPTVNDFLSAYVKQAVKPMVGTQQPTLSWADPDRFKQTLQNMSGDLRRGALHGKAGATARQELNGKSDYLPLSIKRLKGLDENPVLNSWTHALHGKAGINEREDGKLQLTAMRLKGLVDNPVLKSWTHALHGKAGIHEREGQKLQLTTMRLKGLDENPVLKSWTHALHGLAGSQQPRFNWASPERFKQMLKNMSGDFNMGALHGKAGIQIRESFTQKDGRTGKEKEYKNLLPTTIQRLKGLQESAVKGSWTHALHGKEGIHLRDSFTQQNSRTGKLTSYKNLLPTTVLRLKGLSDDPVKGSWTHALHGRAGVGGLGNFTFNNGKFKTDRTKQIEDLRLLNKPLGALFGRAGISGSGGFTFSNGRFKSNHTKLLEDIRSAASFRSSGALHGKAGSNIRGTASTVNTKGQTLTFNNLLNPTVRRYEALRDNPVLGSQTHALYGMAGSQQPGYSWESPERFKKHLASMSGVKTGALHGRSSGVSASNGLVDGLADMLKGMIFGSSTWPMTKFYFYVLIGGIELGFQTVEGLEAEIGVIEYRDGNSPLLAKERIPGLVTYNKVTLKKGMFANDTSAANLFKEIATDRQYTKRRSILIAMLDHNHIPQFIWRYEGCFITKFTPANLDAESESEIAVEEMEFAGRSFTTETLMGMAAGLVGGALSGSVSLPF